MRIILKEDLEMRDSNRISWERSVGRTVRFIYDDIRGSFVITKYYKDEKNRRRVVILYDYNEFDLSIGSLKKCQLEYVVTNRTKEYTYKIGDIVNGYEVIKHSRRNNNKSYIVKCTIDGYINEVNEGCLIKGNGCPVCSNKIVVHGINDIATTNTWMIDYIVNEKDLLLAKSSNKKILLRCPYCGNKKMGSLSNLYMRHAIGCACGDGVSYPNKFMFNLLKQLNVYFETEYTPKWANGRRYDFYVPSKRLIIEMDGGLGHGNRIHSKSDISLEQSIYIDEYKDYQANNIGLSVIRIECLESNLQYIKNKVLESELNNIFDLNVIDWYQVEEFAVSNMVKKCCDIWHQGISLRYIGSQFGISPDTVRRYLKDGVKLGWCDYDSKTSNKIRGKSPKRKAVTVFKDNINVGDFDSINELAVISMELFGVQFNRSHIGSVCNGKRLSHKGYTFRYKNEVVERDND